MMKQFSKVKFGQAFKQYDDWDGDRYFVKVDDGAVCAFDWYFADENPFVYDCFDDDEMVEVVPLMEAMDWVREAIEEA
jgi:hypothetical protein